MRVLLAAVAATFAIVAPASAQSPNLVVNEIDYDQDSTDTAEFVEIRNNATSPVDLNPYALRLVNGNNNVAVVYATVELPAVDLAPGDYYVVCGNAANVTGCDLDVTPDTNLIQNGNPDAVAIVDGDTIVDTVSYGGVTPAYTEGPTGATTDTPTVPQSIGRFPNGCDTGMNAVDFSRLAPATPGGSNGGTACGGPADAAPSVSSTDPGNGASQAPLGANVSITFSEDVTLTGDPVSIQCTRSGAHTATQTGGPRTYTFDPAIDFVRNETCTVRVAAAGVSDQDADDPPDTMASDHTFSFSTLGLALRIHDIQAAQHLSPYDGDFVAGVPGVVTALATNGFWFQDTQPDGDERTSEGMFVFTGSAPPTPAIGQAVAVDGRVNEFRAPTDSDAPSNDNLTITEVEGGWAATGAGTITPTTVGFGGRIAPIFVIDNDAVGGSPENDGTPFDPRQDGIDFHESLEGMLVRVNNPVAVGPPAFGELPVVGDRGFLAFPRTNRGGVVVRPNDFNPERIFLDDGAGFPVPTADVRDRLDSLQAVVDYSFGNFKYKLTTATTVQDGGLQRETTESPRREELAVASMNVENLDPTDPPDKFDELATILVNNMQAPDLVAVEEVQDNNGPGPGTSNAELTYAEFIAAVVRNGGPTYQFRQIDPVPNSDGGEPNGNIRVGFLFRTDRGLSFVDEPGGAAVNGTQVVDGPDGPHLSFSPGRIDPTNPAFNNSRKPLAGEFRWNGRTLFVVGNHFNSKGGDDPLFGRWQPPVRSTEVQRHQQATVVADFVEQLLAADGRANVVVLGDLNDFEFSETLDILEDSGLTNLMETLPVPERYSYVFEGNSQTLDQILVSDALMRPRPEYDSVHVNAEFADQASDHDPQVARLQVTGMRGERGGDD
jgi:uncharacterized protein